MKWFERKLPKGYRQGTKEDLLRLFVSMSKPKRRKAKRRNGLTNRATADY